MVRCSVIGCKSDSGTKMPGLSFHSFPEHDNLRQNWIVATGRTDWTPKPSSKICSRHFEDKMLIKKKKLTLLLPSAVPILETKSCIPSSSSIGLNEETLMKIEKKLSINFKVTAGSSPSLLTKMPNPIPQRRPFVTDMKSALDPVEMQEDARSESTLSIDEEDQLSDADQPSEDLIPLSKDQVPPTNAQDPLTEVKEEEPELTEDDAKVKEEEVGVTEAGVQVPGAAVPTVQVPRRDGQEVSRAANDNADLIRTQSLQIAKLTARLNHTQRQLTDMLQLLRRRDDTISGLRAERDRLAGQGGGGRGGGGGERQVQRANDTVEEKKTNRKLIYVKHVRKSFDRTQPAPSVSVTRASQILRNTLENGQKSSVLKRTVDIRENSDTAVKRSLNIVEKSSLGVQDTSSDLNKSSVGLQQTSDNRQKPSPVVKPESDVVKSPPFVVRLKSDSGKVSLIGYKRKLVNQQKPTITVKKSEVVKSPSLVADPTSDNRLILSVGVQTTSENRPKSSLVVQPKSDDGQMSSVALQRTSDIRPNAVVIQIDGMHNTVLQPKLVRLDDCMETL